VQFFFLFLFFLCFFFLDTRRKPRFIFNITDSEVFLKKFMLLFFFNFLCNVFSGFTLVGFFFVVGVTVKP
jgi:hypothetical protein